MTTPLPTPASSSSSSASVPALQTVRLGYVPLTDCAPLLYAVEKGLDRQFGLRIELHRQPSWAAVRDKLLSGELEAAHTLAGLALGVELGIGGPQHPMAVLMTLNQNGQAITLSRKLAERMPDPHLPGALSRALGVASGDRGLFAHTFPTGSHAMWLYYWLAVQGVNPLSDIYSAVIPPPQMATTMLAGELDGFCAGEPWSALAEASGVGVTACATDAVWPDHPDKVLACTRLFATTQAPVARALVMTLLTACRMLDEPEVRLHASEWLSRPGVIDAPPAVIAARLSGDYRALSPQGRPKGWPELDVAHGMRFFGNGEVTFPYISDAIWFMTQYVRWGMLADAPDYQRVAHELCQTTIYRDAAHALDIPVPSGNSRSSTFMDGQVWDGSNPEHWASLPRAFVSPP